MLVVVTQNLLLKDYEGMPQAILWSDVVVGL